MALTGKPGSDPFKRAVTIQPTYEYATCQPLMDNWFILGHQIPHLLYMQYYEHKTSSVPPAHTPPILLLPHFLLFLSIFCYNVLLIYYVI